MYLYYCRLFVRSITSQCANASPINKDGCPDVTTRRWLAIHTQKECHPRQKTKKKVPPRRTAKCHPRRTTQKKSAFQDGWPKKKKKVPSKTDDQVPSKKDDPKKKCLPRRTTKKQEQNKRCSEKICWCLRGLGPNSMLDTYFGIMNLFDTYFWSHLLTALDPPISI